MHTANHFSICMSQTALLGALAISVDFSKDHFRWIDYGTKNNLIAKISNMIYLPFFLKCWNQDFRMNCCSYHVSLTYLQTLGFLDVQAFLQEVMLKNLGGGEFTL